MERFFTAAATRIAALAGQPIAFIIASSLILIWLVSGPFFHFSDTWQLVVNTATTIVTFLMVFLIQNSQNRDAAALQAKLDELLRALEGARNEFIGIEHLSDHQIEKIREQLERDFGEAARGKDTARSVDRLLRRR
jgi:low affinity Fe/Cu permease